jgi:Rps23 Pro-64 3,4-dihydroxylase Tpa1-like proline 4-hydroxylase
MIDIEKFREEGYLYDSLENYTEFIDINQYSIIKSKIDEIPFKRYSRYDYWYKYQDLAYMEEIVYEKYLKQDNNLDCADYVFNISHQYQLEKMARPEFYPTWVFGSSEHIGLRDLIKNDLFKSFQWEFTKKYYSDKLSIFNDCESDTRLQFYDKGCEIKLHDDGKPENRLCVFLYFLNTEWKDENGGHLILHTKDNQKIKINPVFPNFVVLDSDVNLFHEVEMVKADTKYNIVCFYKGLIN